MTETEALRKFGTNVRDTLDGSGLFPTGTVSLAELGKVAVSGMLPFAGSLQARFPRGEFCPGESFTDFHQTNTYQPICTGSFWVYGRRIYTFTALSRESFCKVGGREHACLQIKVERHFTSEVEQSLNLLSQLETGVVAAVVSSTPPRLDAREIILVRG